MGSQPSPRGQSGGRKQAGPAVIRRHASELRALLMIADAVVAAATLIVLSFVRFGPEWIQLWDQYLPQPAAVLVAYAVGWVGVLLFHGLYRPRARWSIRGEAGDILRATVTMALLTLSVLFVFRLPDVSRLFLVFLFPVQYMVTLGTRALLRITFETMRKRGYNTRYTVVLGAGPRGRAYATRVEAHQELGLRISGFLDDDAAFAADLPNGWSYLGSLTRLEGILHDRVIDEVAICLPFTQWTLIDGIARLCEEEGKIVRIPMDVIERTISTGRVEELDGVPVFSLVSGPDRAVALAIKRLIDLAAGLLGLVLLSPLLAMLALAIVLDDGRPVVFAQGRVGLHGRSFRMLKFRSMRRDAEAMREALLAANEIEGPAFKITSDPRLTRVGRVIRRFSLDELPQLWNVVRGDMSLVGPRPPLPGEVAAYDLWHRRRLSMKPGMTGLWQVRSRRAADFDQWVAADLEYIDRWSLALDAQILIRTIPAALEGR
jgi:exopolysaccharide biosynthesis polyprenyl glycosylphosphotransferase